MRCHYWIFNTRNILETIDSFARGPYLSSFQPICVHFVDKNADRDQNCSFDLIYFQRSGVYTLIFPYVPYIVTGLVHGEPANFYREKRRVAFVTGHLFTFLVVLTLICLVTSQTHTHTHTKKKDIVCLMTSARPTSSPHKLFSNSHHDERTSFLITNLPKHEREFIPKVSKVRINRIQLHLYSRSPRNR